jgi:hypothetical protein
VAEWEYGSHQRKNKMNAKTIWNLIMIIALTVSANYAQQEFTFTTTAANLGGIKASIDMPGLTGNPLAIIIATPLGDTETLNPHPIGAWYYSGKWYLVNVDSGRMPEGAKYKVQFYLKPSANQFLHIFTQQNIGSEGSYIDHPSLNNNPNAQFKILQNHSPEIRTPYNLNRFEAKAAYSSAAGRWYIANVNSELQGRGSAYNIVITSGATAQTNKNPNSDPNQNTDPNKNPNLTNQMPSKDKLDPGADAKDTGTPPKSQEQPPTETEIMEKLNKAAEKQNEISKDITSLGQGGTDPGKATQLPQGTSKMTGFDVTTHGLRFLNDFRNSVFGPPIKVTTGGLCGGMSYTALDFYLAKVETPKQDYRPAHSFVLQTYLYQRQETSLLENLDKWVAYHANPFGTRNLEIFNWGLREQLAVLRTYIDRGVPVPLGLKWTGGDLAGKDHQVLAIGYDMGRYKGDVGNYKEDLKIFLYEPNHPGKVITLVADASKLEFYYAERPDKRWRSYFVDDKYRAMSPPTIPNPVEFNQVEDGLVHALRLNFQTGVEELRGGSLHVNLKILFTDGTEKDYQNISQGGRWLPGYWETVEVALTTPRRFEEIRSIMINTNNTIGITGDRWDMESVDIYAIGGGFARYMELKNSASFKFAGLPLFLFPK